jgi:hypothetical protein
MYQWMSSLQSVMQPTKLWQFSGEAVSAHPEKLFSLDLSSGKVSMLLDPKKEQMKDVEFGGQKDGISETPGNPDIRTGFITRPDMILQKSILSL